MKPTIEPPPHDRLKRALFAIHSWPLQDGDVAIHESGHIAVGLALGMPSHDARITQDGTAGRAGVVCPLADKNIARPSLPPDEVAGIYLQCACLIWPGLPTAEAALCYAMMLVAGRQAELIAAGIRLPGELRMHDPDHLQARTILCHTGQRLAMTWAQRQARHLLTVAWPLVESIAADLRERGSWTNPAPWVRQSSYPSTIGDIENGK